MRLVRFALQNPYWVVVNTLILGIIGGVCLTLLPKDILPTFKTSAVQVVTFYPGMPAEVMEKDITTRLERWTGQSNGIARQESKSMIGVSIVKDFFRPDIDPNTAMSQVTSFAMSDLFYLPPGTIPPMVMPFDPTASVPLALITVRNPDMDESKLFDVAYFSLRNLLQGISGVIAPAVYGGKLRRVLAYIDPARMADRNLSGLDIVQALRESNVLIPTGDAKIGDKDVQIVTDALVPQVDQMNEFPIRAHEGVEIKMNDVAHVEDSHQIQTNIVRVNGKRQVYIPIYRQPGANTIQVVDGIKKALSLILERLPKGMKLDVVADQSIFVRQAIQSLSHEVILGGVLAALMVFLFLRSLRSSIAIFIAIPISILTCFIGLTTTGETLNAMTLGGLALAVGRLIDDSIVVLENITRFMEEGMPAREAALHATAEVAMPVLAATVTTVIVFLPVFFLTGIGKFLFTPLAKAVAFSIGASYLVSVTVIPIFCAKFLKPHSPKRVRNVSDTNGKEEVHSTGLWYDRLAKKYERFLKSCLKVRGLVIGATVAAFIASLFLYSHIGKELFPTADVGHLTVHLRMPTGTRVELTEAKAAEIERRLTEVIEPSALKIVITNIGVLNDWPAAYTPNAGPGDMFLEIELNDERKYSAQKYADLLRDFFKKNFPEAEASIDTGGMLTAALNMGLAAPINIQVEGNDLSVSHGIAEKIVDRIKGVPGAVDVHIQERLDYPQIVIELNRPKIARLGLTVEEVVKNVVSALNSSINFAPSFWIDPKNGNHYFLGAQYPEKLIENLDTIKNIGITGKRQDRVVRLGEIASFKEATAPSEIRHLNIKRVVNIFAGVSGRDVGGVAEEIQASLPEPAELPEGVRVHMRGEVSSMKEAFQNLGFGLILAIILVHLVLSGQFRSFADPLLILTAVPLGLMGVFVTLWLTHTTFNVQSFLGIIFMVGIAVSNSILLIEFANREIEKGGEPDHAILEAAQIRLRPILMTSFATVLGLIPMAIGIGHGSEANVPLARAVLGGILASTLLVLIVVPMLYSALQRFKGGLSRKAAVAGFLLPLILCLGSVEADAEPMRMLSYQEAVSLAIKNNPGIRVAETQVEELAFEVRLARAPFYPRLAASAMDSSGLGGSSSAIGITGLVNSPYRKHTAAGVDAAWNIYDFGRTSYRSKAAEEKLHMASASLEKAKQEVRLKVTEAYFRCSRTQRSLTVLDDQLRDQEQVAKEVVRYVRSGLRSPVELNLVKGTSEGIRARRAEVVTQQTLAMEDLKEAIGIHEMEPFQCQADFHPSVPDNLSPSFHVEKALSTRPEILVARRQILAAEAEWKAARQDHWPILSAVGSAGFLSETSLVEKNEWSAGAGIRVPLFEGFRLSSAEDKARKTKEESEFRLSVNEQAVTKEVRNAVATVSGLHEKRIHLDQQERLVREAYRLARERYLNKTGVFTDLRDAQNMFFQVTEQAIAAQYDENLAVERLNILSGS